jgi:hypothetical protein
MKHLRRWLFNALAAMSLLLCAATAALWVRSYYAMEVWNYRGPVDRRGFLREQTVRALKGRIWYGWQLNGGYADLIPEYTNSPQFSGFHSRPLQSDALETWSMKGPQFAGFEYLRLTTLQNEVFAYAIIIPIWAIAMMTAVLPALWLWRRLPRRFAAGFCRSCGYDLRATPDRCPECGTVPKKGE